MRNRRKLAKRENQGLTPQCCEQQAARGQAAIRVKSTPMDEINNPHDVYFRESFTRREIAQDFLRQHLPAELLEVVDLDSLEISKDS
ncbi:Rpn family recombination-promoting nuclease/putative transposase [Halochromatium roseum]|uniref:Rpn family recombination-promoting nuclease/putative transposase n=1 Tax=Halochromatium roseum TaxID=391920 RepID=UPI001A933563|nr:Rpn family recombination-promoting nuclease/putative transposase [Halochromatium roseum]